MIKYEYKCVAIVGFGKKTKEELNKYGKEGWELVDTWSFWFYFKRPIE